MFTLAIDMGATQCVSSKRQAWPSPAAAYPKILGQYRAFQHGFHPSIIQRDISTCTQTYKKKPKAMPTTNLTGPHRDKRTAGSESINNTFICVSLSGHVGRKPAKEGSIVAVCRGSWWTPTAGWGLKHEECLYCNFLLIDRHAAALFSFNYSENVVLP